MMEENKIILYKDKEGRVNVNVRFADEDVWLTQAQLAEIYQTTQQNISLHQKGIYADGELDEEATHKKYLLVRQEGKRQVKREIDHYNLDMIIALGYRVQSPIAVRFRRWATRLLHEYIQKGFTMDDERLNGWQPSTTRYCACAKTSSKALVLCRIRKPLRKQSVSLKSIVSAKCVCLRATSTRPSNASRICRKVTTKKRREEYE